MSTQPRKKIDTSVFQDQARIAPVVRSFRESDADGVLALSGPSREALGRLESLWVAELDGTIVGMVSVAPAGLYVARISDLSVDPQWREITLLTRLLNVALCHCRRSGVLKVLLDAELAPAEVLEVLRGCGFQFSRQRQANGENLLEFYVNLYASPKCEDSNDIPRQA